MSLNDVVEAIPRKTMVLFFLLDTSGSMSGSKIGAVNAAIDEVIPELRDISISNADAEIKIAVLEFADSADWITEGPAGLENFVWKHLDAVGSTGMGAACRKLNDALSTRTFMREAVGSFAPAIFLLSDGQPTDDFDGGLEELKKNNWFKAAIKAAVAIGDDADKDCLARFTGSMESVLEVHNRTLLRKLIKFVSVRASQIASRSVQAVSVTGNVPAGTPPPAAPADAVTDQNNPSPAAVPVPADAPAPEASIVKQAALNEQLAEIKAQIADAGDDEW